MARVDGAEQGEEESDFLCLLQLERDQAQPEGLDALAEEQWRDGDLHPLIQYLEGHQLPDGPTLARKVAAQATQFVILDRVPHRPKEEFRYQ